MRSSAQSKFAGRKSQILLRRLFRQRSTAAAQGEGETAPRQIEITVERETVSVLYPAGPPGDQRCPCCGQEISVPQQSCPAHEIAALPAEASGSAASTKLLSDSGDEVKE